MKKLSIILFLYAVMLPQGLAQAVSQEPETSFAPKTVLEQGDTVSQPAPVFQTMTAEGNKTIFIYHIPDDDESNLPEGLIGKEIHDVISDDVTADTTQTQDMTEFDVDEGHMLKLVNLSDDDGENDYPNVLKGYAVYEVEEEDVVTLTDEQKDRLSVKILRPFNYKGGKYYGNKNTTLPLNYSKFSNMEYSIAPIASIHARKVGGFTTGTTFNQMIDTAELEQSTGVFSRYDTKHFAIYTAYSKTLNSTNSNYNDNFYISPEFKLNQYFTLKEILSANITKNRKKAEIVLSINPFGHKDSDRLRIEFGANATYDDNNALLKNQLKFSTKYNW